MLTTWCKYEQPRSDLWDTPPWVWEEVAQFISTKDDVVWEPFVSSTHYSKSCWENLDIQCIETESDFFETTMPSGCTLLVSNPPFSRKFDVLERVFEENIQRFALVFPANTYASASVKRLIQKYNVNDLQLYVPSKRMNFRSVVDPEKKSRAGFDSVFICRNFLPRQLVFAPPHRKKNI